jgi:hypothetical protein
MWSHESRAALGRALRLATAMAAAGLVAACFQPLYGDRTLPNGSDLRAKLASIEVAQIPGIDITYSLTELATGKVVINGTTFSRVSSDVPGEQQRFAHARAQRDAEDRAAKVVAEQIRNRLTSYMVART